MQLLGEGDGLFRCTDFPGGLRPICEIQYLDYLLYALQIMSDDLASLRWYTVKKGDTLLSLAFDSTTTGYWSQRGAGGEPFKLDFWRVDELTPTDSTLRGGPR